MGTCPNCQSNWNIDEAIEGYCNACGYPNHDEDDEFEEVDPFCAFCGMPGDNHAIHCPDNDSPFARLMRDGYD